MGGGGAKHLKLKAFTLAEVLITLGVIGVVAAMTMPTIIQKHKEQETVAKVKKFYSVISQAVMLARAEHGDVDTWDFAGVTQIANNPDANKALAGYLKPHLQIIKDCADNPDKECLASSNMHELDGRDYGLTYNDVSHYKFILKDGSHVWLRANGEGCKNSDARTQNVCGLVWYDVNDKKPPYTMGKDIFVFFILKNAVVPHSNDDCYIDKTGWGCSKYILEHGDMSYLH